jgi:hypothetical protein
MHYRKLNNNNWKMIEERSEKKLSSWKGKYLSVRTGLVLINSVLSSLPMFMLSFFEIPKVVLEKMTIFDQAFLFAKMIVKRRNIDSQSGV